MSKPKVRFMNPPADTLWFYFDTEEALRAWVDDVKSTSGSPIVSLPSGEDGDVRFFMLQGKILGLIINGEDAKK